GKSRAWRKRAREGFHGAVQAWPNDHNPDVDGARYVAFINKVEVVTETPAFWRYYDRRIARSKPYTECLFSATKVDCGIFWILIRELRSADNNVTCSISIE